MKGLYFFLAASCLVLACSPTDRGESVKSDVAGVKGSLNINEEVRSNIKNGPFGIAIGQNISELDLVDRADSNKDGIYLLNTVPRPSPEFDAYGILAFPDTGVCEIRSISKPFESDSYGVNVKASIDALMNVLVSKYGKPKKTEFCERSNCQFFQMGLEEGSTGYGYQWSRSSGATLPADIAEIFIVARAGEYNGTFFTLNYISSQKKECAAARNKLKASGL